MLYSGFKSLRFIKPVNKRLFCSIMSGIQPFTETFEDHLYQHPVVLKNENGDKIELQAIFQDTLPEGSSVGTVVTLHGAPGSHKDFKYMVPYLQEIGIRCIGINFPGFGYTLFDPKLTITNMERVHFVEAIINEILKVPEDVIFLGHSRGTENALKMAVLNQKKSLAAVLVNPVGLRPHRPVRPVWMMSFIARLYDLKWPWVTWILENVLYYILQQFGIKSKTPFIAALITKNLSTTEFANQQKFINLANQSDLKIVNVYGSKDRLIEKEISQEFAVAFKDNIQLYHNHHVRGEEPEIINSVLNEINRGTRHLSINFTQEGHSLQKDRAYFLAKIIQAILEGRRKALSTSNNF